MRDSSPYRILPAFYDAVMAHVDYYAWGAYLRRLWEREGIEPQRILELAAGTCPFHRTGAYPKNAEVVYSDLSPGMLHAATLASPARQGENPAPAWRIACNALSLPFGQDRFDVVIMVYDAFNYLMDRKGVLACLAEVRRVLRPGGVFIFDVTTQTNSRRHFTDFLDIEELPEATLIRRTHYDGDSRLQENAFTIFVREADGNYRREEEKHQQRVFELNPLQAWAESIGFTVKGRYAGFSLKPGSEASERVHFVLSR